MRIALSPWTLTLAISLAVAVTQAACGGDGSISTPIGNEGAGGATAAGGAGGSSAAAHAGAAGTSGSTGAHAGASGGHAGSTGAAGNAGSGAKAGGNGAGGASGSAGHAGAAGSSGASHGGAAGSTATGGKGGEAGQSGLGQGGATAGHSGASGSGLGTGGNVNPVGTGGSAGTGPALLDVEPTPLQTIIVPIDGTSPTVQYAATLGGSAVSAGWSDDRGDIGTVAQGPSSTTLFTPSGTTGGLVNVLAGYEGMTVTRQVFVKLNGTQNGPNTSPGELSQIPAAIGDLTKGGGVGGVGGEGLGPMIGDQPTLAGLMAPTSDGTAQKLKLVYPYDKTVWPRGMLAPLLMWDWTGTATAVLIHLETTSGSFSWTGTFGRPAILPAGKPFVRHPIPQDVWEAATNTAGGATPDGTPDQLNVSVTLADATGAGYGPTTETWNVAPGRLSGIIYYNSYGTQLAKNLGGAVGGDHMFGGAVLSIHVGDTAPKVAAGGDGNESNCRVCHSVAGGGSRLIVQHGDSYTTSSAYDLKNPGETVLATSATFPAVSYDGTKALSPDGQILPLPNDSAPITPTGISSVTTNLGTPAFSPDGTKIAFNPMSGPLSGATRTLVVMDYDGTSTFTNPRIVADDSAISNAEIRPGWPAFFPDGNSIVFQHQSIAGSDGNGSGSLETRKGAFAQIGWTNTTDPTHVTPLNALNGFEADGVTTYLPKLDTPNTLACSGDGVQVGGIDKSHEDDVDLNYEPTVNPVASGGYAWVVFTSRRMYGNEAVIPPFCSDPRGVDLVANITPKKLWVAAIDLNAAPGTDASHPGFYLPAQELLAGNARGFWVQDPCKADGMGCQSGDQCCNGYCEANTSGALVCSNTPPNGQCSGTQEKCASLADCCDQTEACVNGFCVQAKPLAEAAHFSSRPARCRYGRLLSYVN